VVFVLYFYLIFNPGRALAESCRNQSKDPVNVLNHIAQTCNTITNSCKLDEQARSEAMQEVLAQMMTGKKIEELPEPHKDKVKQACVCIGLCPNHVAASKGIDTPIYRVCSSF
jgi:hypothetical protein